MRVFHRHFFSMFTVRLTAVWMLLVLVAGVGSLAAQDTSASISADSAGDVPGVLSPLFRVEKVPVEAGAELITIFSRRSISESGVDRGEVPLVSILKDTLGDDVPQNDRLRYFWMLSYTKPTIAQRIASVVPFFYFKVGNKGEVGTAPPPVLIDLQTSEKTMWKKVFWIAFKGLVINQLGVGAKSSALQLKQNTTDYKKASIASALAVLSVYQDLRGERILSDSELGDIQARLSLDDKLLGFKMQPENLGRVYEKEVIKQRDLRGHNWELLRQACEEQGLYFDPLEMPDGESTHAIVWTTAEDLKANKGRSFNRRFLNIKDPWKDESLAAWKGYSEVRWFDGDDREVAPETPGAKARTMIPLAIYGLDHPKIPIILVDFRDTGNPKIREMSKRVLSDITTNVLALSKFSSVPYFVGRFVYEFVTGRRGIDLNQASRYRSYSQLNMLLAMDESLDPDFRKDISDRVDKSVMNPLQNDIDAEARVSKAQYANLLDYAKRPDGLSKKIFDDRREEMNRLKHNKAERALLAMAHVASLGLYTHRETESPELMAQLDIRRQLDYHERFLREVAYRSARPEIDNDMAKVRESLTFISANGSAAQAKTSRAIAKIFRATEDDEARTLCLAGLYKINNGSAKNELLAIYRANAVDGRWRQISAQYLKLAIEEKQHIWARDAKTLAFIGVGSTN